MAQTITGLPEVGLVGGESNLSIVNQVGNANLTGFVLRGEDSNGRPTQSIAVYFTAHAVQPDGVPVQLHMPVAHSNAVAQTSKLMVDSAWFDDGKFIGPDKSKMFNAIQMVHAAQRQMISTLFTKNPSDLAAAWQAIENSTAGHGLSGTEDDKAVQIFRGYLARDLVNARRKGTAGALIERLYQIPAIHR
jgi:hypothetical protein